MIGSYYLIYFGFVNCPDICPLTMHKMNRALEKIKKLPEAKFFDLKALFISCDPDRDSPEKIKRFLSYWRYLSLFPGNNFIGLTGKSNNSPELKDTMKKFKIYCSKIEYEEEDTKNVSYKMLEINDKFVYIRSYNHYLPYWWLKSIYNIFGFKLKRAWFGDNHIR